MRTLFLILAVIMAFTRIASVEAATYHAAPAANYRCNEFKGASKSTCMRNQERAIRCSGKKGMTKRECMKKTEPYRGTSVFRRFSR
ncbi:hypothetical protein A2881_01990 [Candidatus Peribacteria bacterium RIFCSPHIGHO2_01_FULL_55_13]|nr:MAG: hypothetical protein A2881_01990 [Candidatus Peribacteria bacterium RIFCSPHIGHO2_01_FULL_55_13]OGJ65342.1 MAG: hypothetical protein A3F36_02225 [Candidatus Peribacteria bacterium RIFCSPHIGHO2_12_FULL_55_11]